MDSGREAALRSQVVWLLIAFDHPTQQPIVLVENRSGALAMRWLMPMIVFWGLGAGLLQPLNLLLVMPGSLTRLGPSAALSVATATLVAGVVLTHLFKRDQSAVRWAVAWGLTGNVAALSAVVVGVLLPMVLLLVGWAPPQDTGIRIDDRAHIVRAAILLTFLSSVPTVLEATAVAIFSLPFLLYSRACFRLGR